MEELCIDCKKKPIHIKKRKLCKSCYHRRRYQGEIYKNSPIRHVKELDFVRNFFTHSNWIYQPATFRFNGNIYQPDFYDAERNVFIEVAGTKQAFSSGFEKYELFIETFPKINFEIRDFQGNIKPLTKRPYIKKKTVSE